MPESLEARIRPFEPKDNRLVHFMIAKINFSVLAVANNRGPFSPTTTFLFLLHH
jgi:hypothetical protein